MRNLPDGACDWHLARDQRALEDLPVTVLTALRATTERFGRCAEVIDVADLYVVEEDVDCEGPTIEVESEVGLVCGKEREGFGGLLVVENVNDVVVVGDFVRFRWRRVAQSCLRFRSYFFRHFWGCFFRCF